MMAWRVGQGFIKALAGERGDGHGKNEGRIGGTNEEKLEREIARTDAEIDDLVYGLYGITDEERRIIEEG